MKNRRGFLIDLAMVNEKDYVSYLDNELKSYQKERIDMIFEGSLDHLDFSKEDIDDRFVVLEDGGECIVLKDGRIFNVSFRGAHCRVWKNTDNDYLYGLIRDLKEGTSKLNK